MSEMTFESLLDAYRSILARHPGKAMAAGGAGNYAALASEGYLYGVTGIVQEGTLEIDCEYDFDSSAFDESRGAWDDMTREETLSQIESPLLVSMSSAEASGTLS